MKKEGPLVSIIIPVFNPNINFLKRSLRLMIKYENNIIKEILLIQDKSDSKFIDIKALKNISIKIKLILQSSKGPAAARNTGVYKSLCKIIVFIDSDCVPVKNWVKEIIKPILFKKAVGVGGTVRALKEHSAIFRYALFRKLLGKPTTDRNGKIRHIITANCAFLKNKLKEVGGFDESSRYTAEDLDMTYLLTQKGYQDQLYYAPRSIVEHKQRSDLYSFWKQQYGYGYCTIYHCLLRKRDPSELGIKFPTISNISYYLLKYIWDSILMAYRMDRKYMFLDRFIYFPFFDFYRRTAILFGARKSYTSNRKMLSYNGKI